MTTSSVIAIPEVSKEDELLAELARQDVEAFAELYRRHFQRVYRYHLARTGNVVDAQDLTTQTFMAALEGIGGYRATGSFVAWLLGIARRKIAQHYRSRKRQTALETVQALSDPASPPEAMAGQRIQLEQVSQALRNLKPERAEALVLCICSDLTAAEAGRVMGKSAAAVKMLVWRGLRELRQRTAFTFQEEL